MTRHCLLNFHRELCFEGCTRLWRDIEVDIGPPDRCVVELLHFSLERLTSVHRRIRGGADEDIVLAGLEKAWLDFDTVTVVENFGVFGFLPPFAFEDVYRVGNVAFEGVDQVVLLFIDVFVVDMAAKGVCLVHVDKRVEADVGVHL